MEAWLTDMSNVSKQISDHVLLQQRNSALGIVVLSAFTGYLFNYWNDHSLDEIKNGEISLILVLSPILGLLVVFRHLNHELAIVDFATYMNDVVRPKVSELIDDPDFERYEAFLVNRRSKHRMKVIGPFWFLGAEHVVVLGYIATYLTLGVVMRVSVDERAGEAQGLFDWLLYIAGALVVTSVGVSIRSAFNYRGISTSGQNAEQELEGTSDDHPGVNGSVEFRVRGNPRSKIYHLPDGYYYDDLTEHVDFESVEEAVASGYRPANR